MSDNTRIGLGSMGFSVLDLINGENGYPDIPRLSTHQELVDFHRQLLDAADDHPHFLEAAKRIDQASAALARAVSDEARAHVPVIITRLVMDLRTTAWSRIDELKQFDHTDAELTHMKLLNRRDQALAGEAS